MSSNKIKMASAAAGWPPCSALDIISSNYCVLELAYLEMKNHAIWSRDWAQSAVSLCETYAKTMPRGVQDVPKATRRLQDDPRHLQDGP